MYPFRRKPGGDYLVFLGRMSPDKGAHRALAVALETGLPLKIAAKCREPLEIRYFDEFIRPHLGGSIEYVGEVGHADKVELLMGARALISPIDWEEPFGIVMAEAMACGTTCHRFPLGAARCQRSSTDGETGFRGRRSRDEMEEPEVLELADSLDPVVIRKEVEEPLLARDAWSRTTSPRTRRRSRRRAARDAAGRGTTARSSRLALPALGALAAEPLYLLVDTAIVGHLGRPQLAALGIAFTILGGTFAIFNFLQYGTTAQVARAGGAGEEETAQAARRAGRLALARVRRRGLGAHRRALAPQLVDAHGRRRDRRPTTPSTYLRIAAIGFPAAFLALGAQGYLRGVADLRTPLVYPRCRERRQRVPRAALRLRLRLGGRGLGVGNGSCAARDGSGVRGRRAAAARARRGSVSGSRWRGGSCCSGKWIFIRTTALMGSFVLAGAVATRFGDEAIAAHQAAFQLWIFLALVLDAVAIAGQIIVGRELGAGRREEAYGASERMIWLSVALGGVFTVLMLVLAGVLPRAFTGDASVLDQAALLWPIFALMQPLNGAVFALDGILIGASDGPFLALSMVGGLRLLRSWCYSTALEADWGIRGVWAALLVLIVVRLGLMTTRFRRGHWPVTGWA